MIKTIAVYGTFESKVPVRQRYWIRRRDRVLQRYWKKTTRLKKVVKTGRYELSGNGSDLYKAVIEAHRYMPKEKVVEVSAEKFIKNPEKFGVRGSWIESEVAS